MTEISAYAMEYRKMSALPIIFDVKRNIEGSPPCCPKTGHLARKPEVGIIHNVEWPPIIWITLPIYILLAAVGGPPRRCLRGRNASVRTPLPRYFYSADFKNFMWVYLFFKKFGTCFTESHYVAFFLPVILYCHSLPNIIPRDPLTSGLLLDVYPYHSSGTSTITHHPSLIWPSLAYAPLGLRDLVSLPIVGGVFTPDVTYLICSSHEVTEITLIILWVLYTWRTSF